MSKENSVYQSILLFSEQWVKTQFKWFSADDLKQAYFGSGGVAPNNPSTFGIVFKTLAKKGLIFEFGLTKSKNKKAHGRMLKTWISLEYKLRQKQNASNKSNLKLEL